jgi:hypothetical protein
VSDEGIGSIGAIPLRGHERPSRSFRKGRVCEHPGCGTQLSIYNGGDYCYLHEPVTVPRTRGKKIA